MDMNCIIACRKRVIQYRNERQELAACQRLQEGKESKQVLKEQARATASIGPPVVISGSNYSTRSPYQSSKTFTILLYPS